MIISNLAGGLGNQMFQYACARALSLRLGTGLKLRYDVFSGQTVHNGYELERVFGIKQEFATDEELKSVLGYLRALPASRRLLANKYFQWLSGKKFINEPGFEYWPGLDSAASEGGYLHGYWQSEKYFRDFEDVIRSDFAFAPAMNEKNSEVAQMMSRQVSASVHVRRGDYLSNAKALSVHGACSEEYYHRAIDLLLEQFPELNLFAFSDDPEWVRSTLGARYANLVVVDHNRGEDSYNDMRLMSMCNHHILANSSFSWWGAWLNADKNKTVITPKNWFADPSKNTKDLIPDEWIRL